MQNDIKLHILQFKLPDDLFTDLLYIKKSTIPRAGYGLFAARDLPKSQLFSLYLGRLVKNPEQSRKYIMEMPCTYVHKKSGGYQWESVRKDRQPKYIDALDSNDVNQWNFTQPLFLGAHLMNDPCFKPKGITHIVWFIN